VPTSSGIAQPFLAGMVRTVPSQSSFHLNAGDLITRSDLSVVYGGSPYSGGIVPSVRSSTVFLFTDPAEGAQFGYVYDGFERDGSVLYYTGAGQDGDQTLSGSNSPVVTAATKGRTLRVFVAAGTVPGTSTKQQRYVGEFVVDPLLPYERMPAIDQGGTLRTVLVFRLLPVGVIPDALIEAVGFTQIPTTPRALGVPLEINSTQFFETAGSESQVAVRRESELVSAFVASHPEREFSRWAISLPKEHTRLLTDVYDEHDRVLYEAKAISGRSDLRMALGQLYDYRRHIEVPQLRCAVLLPSRPSADLRDLLIDAGLGLVYKHSDTFEYELAGNPRALSTVP